MSSSFCQLSDDTLDPSHSSIGVPPPPPLKTLAVDPSASPEEQALQFGLTVSAFYPPFTLPDRIDDLTHCSSRGPLEDPKPTVAKLTEQQLRDVTHPAIFERMQHILWSPQLGSLYAENCKRALFDCTLFDDGDGATKKAWPRMKVHVVWCDMTAGELAWTAAILSSRYKEADPDTRREVYFHKLDGANHFVSVSDCVKQRFAWMHVDLPAQVHLEEPQRFVELLAEVA